MKQYNNIRCDLTLLRNSGNSVLLSGTPKTAETGAPRQPLTKTLQHKPLLYWLQKQMITQIIKIRVPPTTQNPIATNH